MALEVIEIRLETAFILCYEINLNIILPKPVALT